MLLAARSREPNPSVLCTSRVAFLTSGTSPNWKTRCVRSHLISTETLRAIAPTGLRMSSINLNEQSVDAMLRAAMEHGREIKYENL